MQLRNKKTGEIVDLLEIVRIDDVSNEFYLRLSDNEGRTFKVGFNSLAELNEEWEDYEEPKTFFSIYYDGTISEFKDGDDEQIRDMKAIGNYFESEEEAEKAVEKLKAWKRLKDKGFRFTGWGCENQKLYAKIRFNKKAWATETEPDLDLLFGGEE